VSEGGLGRHRLRTQGGRRLQLYPTTHRLSRHRLVVVAAAVVVVVVAAAEQQLGECLSKGGLGHHRLVVVVAVAVGVVVVVVVCVVEVGVVIFCV